MNKAIKKDANNDDYQATIEKLKKLIVEINYSQKISVNKTQIDKNDFWKKARNVGRNPISDDPAPSRTLPAAS